MTTRDAVKQSVASPKVKRCEYRHDWKTRDTETIKGQLYCARCGHLPTAKEMQEAEAIIHLRQILKPGDTVYTVLRHVSRSGMSRNIDVYYMAATGGPCVAGHNNGMYAEPVWISGYVGHAIGQPQSRKNWERSQGITVGGCGMDMGFHTVNSLSMVIFPEYKCLGEGGHCPSNYHVNHRNTVQCRGVSEGEQDYFCFRSETIKLPGLEIVTFDCPACGETFPDGKAQQECPKCHDAVLEPARVAIPQGKAHTITHDDGTEVICPTCKGMGRYPNPEGPERWDLVHTDGYALRHKWL